MTVGEAKCAFSWRTFLAGLIIGFASPYVFAGLCNSSLLSDSVGLGRFGIANRAMHAIEDREAAEGLRWANKMISLEPMQAKGYALRGRSQELAGRDNLALADFSVAVAYAKNSHLYLADRAHAYRQLGLPALAAHDYARLVLRLSEFPAPLKDTLPIFLSRDYLMNDEGIRSAADLNRFFEALTDEVKATRDVKRATEVLQEMLQSHE